MLVNFFRTLRRWYYTRLLTTSTPAEVYHDKHRAQNILRAANITYLGEAQRPFGQHLVGDQRQVTMFPNPGRRATDTRPAPASPYTKRLVILLGSIPLLLGNLYLSKFAFLFPLNEFTGWAFIIVFLGTSLGLSLVLAGLFNIALDVFVFRRRELNGVGA